MMLPLQKAGRLGRQVRTSDNARGASGLEEDPMALEKEACSGARLWLTKGHTTEIVTSLLPISTGTG